MKKLLALIILFSFANSGWSQEIGQPHISVYGDAKKEVVPDVMLWSLSVESRGADLKNVSLEHTKTVKDVLKIVGQQGIEKKQIQTSGMTFGENYVYRDNSRVKEGYIATTSVTFKMKNFDRYEALWLSLSKLDSVSVNSVSYDYSKRIEAQNATRINALLAAKEKAAALASAVGLELGEVITISEDMDANPFASNRVEKTMLMSRMDESGSSIEPGTIIISMKVLLVVGLISK